jgi:hypothetical protein
MRDITSGTAAAILKADPEARVGGPAVASGALAYFARAA